MAALSDSFACAVSGIVAYDPLANEIPFAAVDPRTPAEFFQAYGEHWAAIDVVARAVQRRPEGEVVTSPMFLPEVRDSEVWNDYYLRWGYRHQIGGFALKRSHLAASLVVYRERQAPEFASDELRLMQMILPHVRVALQCWLKLRDAAAEVAERDDALDLLSTAVLFLDRRQRVKWMNESARRIIAQQDGLFVSQQELTASLPSDSAKIGRLVKAASLDPPNAAMELQMALQRPSGRGPLVLTVAPVMPRRRGATCMVLINEPVIDDANVTARIQKKFQLTPAEAALAVALASGETPQEFADRRGVAVSTVRTHLGNVLGKTGARRQAELVRIVLDASRTLHRE